MKSYAGTLLKGGIPEQRVKEIQENLRVNF